MVYPLLQMSKTEAHRSSPVLLGVVESGNVLLGTRVLTIDGYGAKEA